MLAPYTIRPDPYGSDSGGWNKDRSLQFPTAEESGWSAPQAPVVPWKAPAGDNELNPCGQREQDM